MSIEEVRAKMTKIVEENDRGILDHAEYISALYNLIREFQSR
jgi:hypothetical protein